MSMFAWGVWRFIADEMVARELVPGTMQMSLDEPGSYTISYEHRAMIDGRTIRTPEQPHGHYTYTRGSTAGQSVGSFSVGEAGDYWLDIDVPGVDQPGYVIAVGQPRLGVFFLGMGSLLCGGGLAAVMLLVGVVLLIVGVTQRRGASLSGAGSPGSGRRP